MATSCLMLYDEAETNIQEQGRVLTKSQLFPKLPSPPKASSSSVRASMQGNRSARTKPEEILVAAMQQQGINRFNRNDSKLPGSPDLVFTESRVAVFVHGCFWHRCPYCQLSIPKTNETYWVAKFARNRARDAQARASLREMGWRPIVIWECKLLKSPKLATARIRRHLPSKND